MYQISLGQIPWGNLFKNLIFNIFDQLLQFWLFLLFCSLQTTIFDLGGCYSGCLTLSLISYLQMYFNFLKYIFDLLMPFFNFAWKLEMKSPKKFFTNLNTLLTEKSPIYKTSIIWWHPKEPLTKRWLFREKESWRPLWFEMKLPNLLKTQKISL